MQLPPSALLALFVTITITAFGCAKKADVCDEVIRIVCKSEYKDERMCNETRKFAEAARQKESVYAQSIAIKVCNDIVTIHEAMIELEKAKKVLDPIRDSIQKDAADRVESMKKK